MRSKGCWEDGEQSRVRKKGAFILAWVFALVVPWYGEDLCAAEAGGEIPAAEIGQLTPLEPHRQAPLPSIDKTIPPPPTPLPPVPFIPESRGAINPRTGERYLPSGKGVYNPRTGEYYPPSGSGYINPRTGEYFPPVDQHRQ
jgi:hypothetical protein